MYLRNVIYQLGTRLKSLLPCFHKSHHENLSGLVVGMVYARRVSLPAAAGKRPANASNARRGCNALSGCYKVRSLCRWKSYAPS